MNLAEKLKAQRELKGMSARTLAELCGMANDQLIYNYERGQSRPPFPKLIKIAKALDVDVSYFVEDLTEKSVKKTEDWKEAEFIERLKQENDRLWALIEKLTGTKVANFRKTLDVAPTHLKVIRGVDSGVIAA